MISYDLFAILNDDPFLVLISEMTRATLYIEFVGIQVKSLEKQNPIVCLFRRVLCQCSNFQLYRHDQF